MRTADEIIPRIIVSIPYSEKGPFSISEISQDIEELSALLGGVSKVAEIAGISQGMLNQFLRIKKLAPKLQALVANRTLNRISLVNDLAKFSVEDQEDLVPRILSGELSGQEIRLLSPLRTQFTQHTIGELIEKLKKSENQKVSVIKFDVQDLHKPIEGVRRELVDIVGPELLELWLDGKEGAIKVTSKGERQLRKAARLKRKSLQDFTYTILQ